MDVRTLLCNGCGLVSDGYDHAVRLYLLFRAVGESDAHAAVADFLRLGAEIDRHILPAEEIAQIRGVGKAYTGRCDEVVERLDNHGAFASQIELVGNLATREPAAYDDDIVADLLFAAQELDCLDAFLDAGD